MPRFTIPRTAHCDGGALTPYHDGQETGDDDRSTGMSAGGISINNGDSMNTRDGGVGPNTEPWYWQIMNPMHGLQHP